jgi:molybdopterin converting factor small subunit
MIVGAPLGGRLWREGNYPSTNSGQAPGGLHKRSETKQDKNIMQIDVKLFANLRKHLPPGSSGSKASISLDEGATIHALIQRLNIPLELAQMVLVNGEQTREFDHPLSDGDTVSIFPPVAGG